MEFITRNKKYFAALFVAAFFMFVWMKSRAGIIYFGDYDISLWKDVKFLTYPYIWLDNEYGFYFPMFVISLPFQLIFRLMTHVFSMGFLSNFYHYFVILAFGLSSVYILKKINKKPDLIDYGIIFFFAIGNPLMAAHIFGGINIVYSLMFAALFIGYLFECRKKEDVSFPDIFLLNIIILFINLYVLNTVLLFSVLFLYVLLFRTKFIWQNKLKSALVFCLFLLLNSFWLLNPAYFAVKGISVNKSIGYSETTANGVMNASSKLVRAFSTLSVTPQYVTDPQHYYSFFMRPFIFIPLLIIVFFIFYSLLFSKHKNQDRKMILFLFGIFFAYSILTLGTASPFKRIFLFLWDNAPGFKLFRATVKFQFVTYFALLILLVYALKVFRGRQKMKLIIFSCTVLLLSFYFFNETYIQLNRQYKIPTYYDMAEEEIGKKKLVSNYKIFPDKYFGSGFAYTAFDWNPNKSDSTNVMILYTGDKPISFQPPAEDAIVIDNQIRNNLCNKELGTSRNITYLTKILSFLNTKNIIMQNDIVAPSITSCQDPLLEYEKKEIGRLDLYSIGNQDFLPIFYTSKNIIDSKRTIGELARIFSRDDYDVRSVVFFEYLNPGKSQIVEDLKNSEKSSLPTLEFKKINPTKYRIRIHEARGLFPLVFSENFHELWQLYGVKYGGTDWQKNSAVKNLNDYKILEGNEEDQASKNEIMDFVRNKEVTSLGDGKIREIKHTKWNDEKKENYTEKYSIDYISKNLQGTIQNNNLPNGPIYETWFKRTISNETNHLNANGYANSWMIDTDQLCQNNTNCQKNPDGSYDLEVVAEFWPQRLFYIGSGISILTIAGCLVFIIFRFKKKDKMI